MESNQDEDIPHEHDDLAEFASYWDRSNAQHNNDKDVGNNNGGLQSEDDERRSMSPGGNDCLLEDDEDHGNLSYSM